MWIYTFWFHYDDTFVITLLTSCNAKLADFHYSECNIMCFFFFHSSVEIIDVGDANSSFIKSLIYSSNYICKLFKVECDILG